MHTFPKALTLDRGDDACSAIISSGILVEFDCSILGKPERMTVVVFHIEHKAMEGFGRRQRDCRSIYSDLKD